MKHCGKVDGIFINIDKTPGDFITAILREDTIKHVAFEKIKICDQCNCRFVAQVSTLKIVYEQLLINDLNVIVQSFFRENVCEKCSSEVTIVEVNLGQFLAIDIEVNQIETFLNIIPETLLISEDQIKFFLTGVIACKNLNEKENKHYTAYCRSSDGQWYERDNTSKPKTGSIKTYPRVKAAVVFYMKYETPTHA